MKNKKNIKNMKNKKKEKRMAKRKYRNTLVRAEDMDYQPRLLDCDGPFWGDALAGCGDDDPIPYELTGASARALKAQTKALPPGIRVFTGDNYWLSNFYMREVWYLDRFYPSAEHAYQAAKATTRADRSMVGSVAYPYTAKQIMRTLPIRGDWDFMRLSIMWEILHSKFTPVDMADRLIATGDLHLEEGNTWGDTFWGTMAGWGENYLGRMLMEIRREAIILKAEKGE